MVWFKVDDKLHDNRKARAAKKAAMGVWVLAGSWAADNGTGGFVPADILSRWGTRSDAKRLVDVGLWQPAEQDGEKGWRFHQWEQRNPDAESERAKRAAESDGGTLGNHRRWHERRGIVVPGCPHCVPDHDDPSGTRSGADQGTRIPPESSRPVPDPDAAAAGVPAPDRPTSNAGQGPDVAVEILASKLRSHTALRGLRTDKLKPEQTARLIAVIDLQGDDRLVEQALAAMRRDNPPQTIQAFLPGWEAMPEPGRRLAVVKAAYCTVPHHPFIQLDAAGACRACEAERKAK